MAEGEKGCQREVDVDDSKVDVLADTVEDDSEIDQLGKNIDRVRVDDDTVLTPTKLTLSCYDQTALTEHFPKSVIKKNSDSRVHLGRSDTADVFFNHKSMSKTYGSIRYDNTDPYHFHIENLSTGKLIEVEHRTDRKKSTKILKCGEETSFENNAVLRFGQTLEFQVCVSPGDLHAKFYEFEVRKEEVKNAPDQKRHQHCNPVPAAQPCSLGHRVPVNGVYTTGGQLGPISPNYMKPMTPQMMVPMSSFPVTNNIPVFAIPRASVQYTAVRPMNPYHMQPLNSMQQAPYTHYPRLDGNFPYHMQPLNSMQQAPYTHYPSLDSNFPSYEKNPFVTQPSNYPVQVNTVDDTASRFYPNGAASTDFLHLNNNSSAHPPYMTERSDSLHTNPELPVQEEHSSVGSLGDYFPVTPTNLQTRILTAVEQGEELDPKGAK